MERTYDLASMIVADRDVTAERRSTWPREKRPRSIAPWLRRS
jgi:hypothetical protein